MKDIRELETDRIKEISSYLSKELCDKYYAVKETQASEIDTIIALIEYISGHRKVKKIGIQKSILSIRYIKDFGNLPIS